MTHILTKEQFQKFQEKFKLSAAARSLTPQHMLLYALVKSKSWDHCFTPIKNEKRLHCQCLDDPLFNIRHAWGNLKMSVKSYLHHQGKFPTGIIGQYKDVFDQVALGSLYLILEQTPTLPKE